MSCRITRKSDGTIDEVFAPNGENSLLYERILNQLPDNYSPDTYVKDAISKKLIRIWDNIAEQLREYALALWNKSYEPNFNKGELDENGESTRVNDLINIQTIKPGVEELFESNPELANIGTKEQYSQYLDTIFPDSKVKDIVYHGTDKDFEGFIKGKQIIPKGQTKGGIWFTDFANADWVYKEENGKVIAALINIKNPSIYNTERVYHKSYGDYLSKVPLKEGQWKDIQKLLDAKEGDGLLLDIFDVTTAGDIGEFTKQQVVFEPEQIHILGSKQDIEGFKEYVNKDTQYQLLDYTTNVNFTLKVVNILQSEKAIQLFKSLEKNKVTGDNFWKKVQELGIPKAQLELLKQYNTTNREELITNMLADYSYTIEINTAKTPKVGEKFVDREYGYELEVTEETLQNQINDGFVDSDLNTQYYSYLTVPGGTNYTENEITTPLITPSIKGHAQFATDKGIGWFRSDEQVNNGKIIKVDAPATEDNIDYIDEEGQPVLKSFPKTVGGELTKTRRILEVQSDLYQKGRNLGDIEQIIKDLQKSGDLKIDCN